ncbi:MAG: hypothetical protein QE278_04435 [Limnobacter sp.]|nr:hypothetical protein [Limnobacter sp.]
MLMKRALVCSSDDSTAASTGLIDLVFAELPTELFDGLLDGLLFEFTPSGALFSTVACAKPRLGANKAALTASAMVFFIRLSGEPFVVIF